MNRLEARFAAEFRALRAELEDVKAQLAARPAPAPNPPSPPPARSTRRSLGRGLDALMSPAPASWWHEGIFPDPARPPGESPASGK